MADQNSTISINVRATDNASSTLAKVQEQVQAVTDAVTAQAERLQSVADTAWAEYNAQVEKVGGGEPLSPPTSLTGDQAAIANETQQSFDNYSAAAANATSATEEFTQATEDNSSAQGLSITRMAQLVIEYDLIQGSIRTVTSTVADAINVSQQYQQAQLGMQTVATEFGQSANAATAAVQNLTQNGLLNTIQAATSLRNLMERGLDVTQAQKLTQAFENISTYGKQAGVDVGASVDSMAQGLRNQYSRTLENNGVLGTLLSMQKEYASSLDTTTNKLSTAQINQAEYNAILRQGSVEAGNISTYLQTASGEQEILANKTQQAKAALGDGLLPAVTLLRQGFVEMLSGATNSHEGLQRLQGDFLTLGLIVRQALNVIVGFGEMIYGTIQSIMEGSLTPLNQAWTNVVDSMSQTWTDYNNGIKSIAEGTTGSVLTEDQKQALAKMQAAQQESDAAAKAARQEQQQIADTTQAYDEANAQRLESFQESLTQMVIAHEQKVADIKGQLADEQSTFEDAATQRKANYTDQVQSADQSYADKVASIQKQITDTKTQGYVVDGELFLGANQKKLDDLNAELAKEDEAHQQQLAKLKKTYDEQTKAATDAFAKKQSVLQQEMDAETAILQKHAADVAAVNSQTAEDDISKLERKYGEENRLATQHFNDQIAKIKQSATDQGVAQVQGFGAGAGAALPGVDAQLQGIGGAMGANLATGIKNGTQAGLRNFLDDLDHATGIVSGSKAIANMWMELAHTISQMPVNAEAKGLVALGNDIGAGVSTVLKDFTHWISGRATGGPVIAGQPYLVGEQGMELFIPDRSGSIVPNSQLNQTNAGTTQTFNFINNGPIQTELDMQKLMRDFAFGVRQ